MRPKFGPYEGVGWFAILQRDKAGKAPPYYWFYRCGRFDDKLQYEHNKECSYCNDLYT